MRYVTIVSPYRSDRAATMPSTDASALNWYTGHVAIAVRETGRTVSVIGPRSGATDPDWVDSDVAIRPTYRRGRLDAPLAIFAAARRQPGKVVHFQHELFAYGGFTSAVAMSAMLHAMRASGMKLLTTMHGVIPLDLIDDAFIRSNGIHAPIAFVRIAWRTLILACCRATHVVHVHEFEHEALLREQYGFRGRIAVCPMGTDAIPAVDPTVARAKLGLDESAHVVLFFGFLMKRKGIVPLLEAVERMMEDDRNLVLVVAGAVPDRLANDNELQLAIERARRHPRVKFLGFVNDDGIDETFAVADVAIFPYTISIAASGPLAQAVGRGLPVLLSKAFGRSFRDAPMSFDPTAEGIARAVGRFFQDPAARSAASAFALSLRETRSWERMGRWLDERYDEL